MIAPCCCRHMICHASCYVCFRCYMPPCCAAAIHKIFSSMAISRFISAFFAMILAILRYADFRLFAITPYLFLSCFSPMPAADICRACHMPYAVICTADFRLHVDAIRMLFLSMLFIDADDFAFAICCRAFELSAFFHCHAIAFRRFIHTSADDSLMLIAFCRCLIRFRHTFSLSPHMLIFAVIDSYVDIYATLISSRRFHTPPLDFPPATPFDAFASIFFIVSHACRSLRLFSPLSIRHI